MTDRPTTEAATPRLSIRLNVREPVVVEHATGSFFFAARHLVPNKIAFAQEPNRVLLSPAVSESLYRPLTDRSRLDPRTRIE